MRALVTRPPIDAAPLAQALEARGFAVLIEPLIDIVPVPGATVPLDDAQGILATSANGVRVLAAASMRRDLPLWAVGAATAAEARRHGFARVETAGGDVAALTALVTARADPRAGALVHVASSHLAGDLAGRLAAKGFAVRRAVLYEARATQTFSDGLRESLIARQIAVALFFSPRTAATFVSLAQAVMLEDACAAACAYALSAAVADALQPLAWRAVRIAAQPNQDALLAAVDADHRSPGSCCA